MSKAGTRKEGDLASHAGRQPLSGQSCHKPQFIPMSPSPQLRLCRRLSYFKPKLFPFFLKLSLISGGILAKV